MRRRDWLPGLLCYVESVRKTPYDPVKHNCALFVSGAIGAMTGESLQERLGARVETMRDVAKILGRFGGVRGICRTFGEMQPPLRARRGDVVVKRGDGGDTIGVCMGNHALFLCPSGLQPRDLTECDGCWAVE